MNYRNFLCGVCLCYVILGQLALAQKEQQKSSATSDQKPRNLDINKLAKQLREPDLLGRLKTLDALSELGPKAAPATDALILTLDDTRFDPNSQRRVCDDVAAVLKGIGQSAVDLVVKKIKETDSPIEYHIYALAIHNFGTDADGAAEFLIEQLAMAKGKKAELTMHALNTLGEAAVPGMPHFVKALNAESFHTRSMACDTLGSIAKWKRPPDEAVKRILEMLSKDVGSTRRHAAECLGQIGVIEGFEIVESLLKATRDRQDVVRDYALRALGQIGPAAADTALSEVKKLMADAKYRNRVQAARSAWLISSKAKDSVNVLQNLLQDLDKNLEAIDTLAEMKSAAVEAVPKLVALLDSPDPDLRMQAVRAIGLIGTSDDSVHSAVEKLRKDSDPDVVKAAQLAVSRLKLAGVRE